MKGERREQESESAVTKILELCLIFYQSDLLALHSISQISITYSQLQGVLGNVALIRDNVPGEESLIRCKKKRIS
jgi:hypothetical protein